MNPVLLKVLSDVAVALTPLLVALVSALAGYLANLIRLRCKSALLAAALTKLHTIVFTVVQELMQTMAAEFKAAAADGKLTPEEKALLRTAALEKLKSYVDLKEMGRLYGIKDEAVVTDLLMSKVESAVFETKKY